MRQRSRLVKLYHRRCLSEPSESQDFEMYYSFFKFIFLFSKNKLIQDIHIERSLCVEQELMIANGEKKRCSLGIMR